VTKKTKPHYVNNKEFLAAMIEWNERCVIAKDKGESNPPITNYIGECFLKIANHLSYRPNFINYTYREEMISDGIENCLQYVHNFNPEKSNNPFAYFTQIIYYAFLRRIAKEKKQTHVKHQLISKQEYVPFDTIDGDTSKYSVVGFDPNVMVPDEAVYKPKKKKEETESKRVGLENFMDEEDIK
jgi:hypothetical protein